MPLARTVLLMLLAPLFVGCGLFQHLQVESLGHTSQKPSNVAAYISVEDGSEPVTDLTEQSFRIYENEQLIDEGETHQTLLDRDLVAYHHTLLLVDMSLAKDENARRQLARGIGGFVTALRKSQGVSVYAFDGRAGIERIGDYPKGQGDVAELAEIASFKTSDPSRNLHGAVIAGVKELGARLMTQKKPIRVGTLVVLTSGADLAGRATAEQTTQALESSGYQLFAIGIGNEGSFDLAGLGKNGSLWSPSLGAVGPTLEDAASHVQRLLERHYLVSYCSPARAGQRAVRIEVVRETVEGKEVKGDVTFEIDATGFGAGCDPSSLPRFSTKSGATKPSAEQGSGSEEPKPEDKNGSGGDKKGGEAPGEKKPGDSDAIVPPPTKPGYAPLPPAK